MTKEDIKKAAVDSCVFENSIFNPELTPYYEQGFKDGANWRINSVWHTMDVVPEREVLLALHGYGRTITIKWNGDMKWKGMDKFFRAAKWAYMDDLLPNKED
ncbi:hypothetical protein [Phocaeicola sp.]|uniref:hypothetical protein n=1 Tax=Phocaeicola sp. TaxID=2773926 RepID=UPI003870DEE0